MHKAMWIAALIVVAFAVTTVAMVDYAQRQPDTAIGRCVASLRGCPPACCVSPGAAQMCGVEPPKAADDEDHLPRILDELSIIQAAKPTPSSTLERGNFAVERDDKPVSKIAQCDEDGCCCCSALRSIGALGDGWLSIGMKALANGKPADTVAEPTAPSKSETPVALQFSVELTPKGADGKRSLSIGLGLSSDHTPKPAGCAANCCQEASEAMSCSSPSCGHAAQLCAEPQCCAPRAAKPTVCPMPEQQTAPTTYVVPAMTPPETLVNPVTFDTTSARPLSTQFYDVDDLIADDRGEQDLINIVLRMVAPESWQNAGGKGDLAYFRQGRTLIVRQTAEVQEQVASLLQRMRGGVRPKPLAPADEAPTPKLESSPTRPQDNGPATIPTFELTMPGPLQPARYELVAPPSESTGNEGPGRVLPAAEWSESLGWVTVSNELRLICASACTEVLPTDPSTAFGFISVLTPGAFLFPSALEP